MKCKTKLPTHKDFIKMIIFRFIALTNAISVKINRAKWTNLFNHGLNL